MKKFALIGLAGYIAPRHLKAIRDTGNVLVAALDPHDSVGIIDSYFPGAHFFTEFERFDRHLEKLRRQNGEGIDYVTVCSPNYLHDAHMRFALRLQADAICEKPLVLNPWNIDALEEIAHESQRNVWAILQLRLHPAIVELKRQMDGLTQEKKHDIDIAYITSRGRWYGVSWKGDLAKSGGVATNIGVHFFDALRWIFGKLQYNVLHLDDPLKAAGFLEFERARVRWFLSTDEKDLPDTQESQEMRSYRSMSVDGTEVSFSQGFTDLHTTSYEEILNGRGFTMQDAKPAIEIVSAIRRSKPIGLKGEYHPLMRLLKTS